MILSNGIEKSIRNRKIKDIIEIYIRKAYNKDIYEYFNINKSEHERSFNIIFTDIRIDEFLKKEKLKLDYKEIVEKLAEKTSSLEYRLSESKKISDDRLRTDGDKNKHNDMLDLDSCDEFIMDIMNDTFWKNAKIVR